MTVKIILEGGVKLPEYATSGSAAVDLRANIEKPIELRAGQTIKIPTGIKLDMGANDSMAAIVLPRSGLGSKGLVLGNTAGLIDQDYQGEVLVMAFNRLPTVEKAGMGIVQKNNTITIEPGMKLAQMLFIPVLKPDFEVVKSFDAKTQRGEGGFGSTGV